MPFCDLVSAFFDQVERAPQRALLLDYDGTLAPFTVDRDRATPYEGVRDLLRQIQVAAHSRLALVSGRSVADLLPLLDLEPHPEIWGTHGWERLRVDDSYELSPMEPPQQKALADAFEAMKAEGLADNCERKPAGLALHWRGLEAATVQELHRAADRHWTPLASASGLTLKAFDGGLELRALGRDKGTVVREILAERETSTAVAYLGDDMTDEDAFQELRGSGLSILVRAERRPTAAAAWLRPPEELLDFLSRWHESAEKGSGDG